MTGIDENNYEPSGLKSVVAGKVYTQEIKESALIKYNETWPNLKITYINMIPQHRIRWQNLDGTLLYEEYMDTASRITDPVERGKIGKPTFESDAQYDYI